ncbi:uncharacterized protein [Dermacentor andersoni]|uniref:uncharacterized protein isoform X4 n=1 Tax=Dermacentor andersoni TaxID=34620 RepID=UPI002415A340|nr:uncharacterized protein LOC126542792 isoform X4 [Dermacentor andersoni]
MEACEELACVTSEPQEQSEGSSNCSSSSEQSNAEDDEWRPCRRKAVRRVNLQRSQATKLMWQRKRAAALLLQQQLEGNAGHLGPSSASGPVGVTATLDQQTAAISHSMSALAVSALSKCKSAATQLQPPKRRRRFPTKATGTTSNGGGSRASGGLGRTKRMPSVNMSWQQRKLAKLRLARLRARDPLSRAIFRRDSMRFSMCWSDTTLGSSLAGKPSVKPKEDSPKNQQSASFFGLKAYRHINAPSSAAGSAGTVEELPTNQVAVNGVSTRPGLERACRPKMFQKDESSASEDSEDDECDTADPAEKMSDSDTDEFMTDFPPVRPTLRPKLLQTSRSQLNQAVKREFRPAQYHTSKTEAATTLVRNETPKTGPRLLCRGNYVTESELLAQDLSVPSTVICGNQLKPLASSRRRSLAAKLRWERWRALQAQVAGDKVQENSCSFEQDESLSNSVSSIGSTTAAPAFALPAKLRWKQNPVERQECAMPAKLRHKQDRLLLSAAKGESCNVGTVVKGEPGTSSRCSIAPPLVATVKTEPKEPPSERRSRAKRLWWEQIKQLDIRLAGGGGGRQRKKAALQPDVPAKTAVVPSRRSLIMKENWRKRKEAWLSAAAQTLAAASQPGCASGSDPPSPNTEQCEDSQPTEDGSQYLARSMALLRCRQYRHDLIAQMDLQQRARPQRHYNARGIHIKSNKDACDCLQDDCPGCHFPCPKCGSQKCGDECRCNRNYVYEQIEVEGYPDVIFMNSLLA